MFLDSIDRELGRDLDSINLFEWVVEDRYDGIINENLDYYSERPDLLHISNERAMFEIDEMLEYFESKEEYEKCGSLLKIKNELKDNIESFV
jgi:beta-glucanase (GH16 family)